MILEKLFGSRLRGKVLGWLFSHPKERYFIRQLESLLGEDKTNLSRQLARLAALGILVSSSEGQQKYYQANEACPFYEELRGLVIKTVGVADVLRSTLAPLAERIDFAFVHGSMARGEVKASSDIDVIVVGTVSFADVVAAFGPAQKRLGREVNPSVYPPEEFHRKLRERHYFLTQVLETPRIMLIGDDDDLGRLAEDRLAGRTEADAGGRPRASRRGRPRTG